MTALPIIEREMRAQARLGFTYGLRVLGAAAMLAVWMFYGFNPDFPPQLGGRLFGYLNCTLFISIWIAVPLLSADCISRERREGTLGLLFLTPLKSREIVLAKGLVHGVRALTLLLATLPILTIPFILGGVMWKEAVLSAFVNFSSICWALAAGLLASSMAKDWVRAQLFACLLGIAFCVAFLYLTGANILISLRPSLRFGANLHDQILLTGLFGATDVGGSWGRMFGSLSGARQWSLLLAQGRLTLCSALVLLAAVSVAAWNLRRSWQELPPSTRQLWIEQKFCTPVLWVPFFRRWMRRKLERNPIGWLEQRTWSGRLVTWGWFAVMISLYSAALNGANVTRLLSDLQKFMAWLLIGVMAVSAAGSFQRERETGVMELLLVSPLSVGQIIGGRLRGLWSQFFPAL
ncbi:MAG TPA: ABC transporter permease subunit, partial [Verrucomicrobiae bacterium]|nr:ABC transporter permease subunit [Verrucomicrobiae bacterium]